MQERENAGQGGDGDGTAAPKTVNWSSTSTPTRVVRVQPSAQTRLRVGGPAVSTGQARDRLWGWLCERLLCRREHDALGEADDRAADEALGDEVRQLGGVADDR